MTDATSNVTKPADEKTEVKKIGSGQKMREMLCAGWDNPKTGILPEKIVSMILAEYKGKTLINDLYFQANKLRHDEGTKAKYGKLLLRDYVKKIEDATGVTEAKAKVKAAEDKEKAAVKAKKDEVKNAADEKKADAKAAKDAAMTGDTEEKAA